MPLTRIAGVLLILFTVLLSSPIAQAQDAATSAKRYLRSKDETARLKAIDALAEGGTRGASALISGRLRDSSRNVRLAAAAALGKIGDKTAVSRLINSVKAFKGDQETLAAVCRALGETGSPTAVPTLAKIATKEMSRDAGLTKAAIGALGRIRSARAVEELVKLLGSASPASTARTYSYGHPGLVSPIEAALRQVTGERLRGNQAWSAWWRRVKRNYRVPARPEDSLKGEIYRDQAFLFQLTRAGTRDFEFRRSKSALLVARFVGKRERATHASVEVSAYSAADRSPSTADALAARYADDFDSRFKDIKELDEGSEVRFAREPAVYQRVLGMTRRGLAVEMRQWVVLSNGHLFTIRVTVSTGADDSVRKDLDRIIKSFRFLKP